MAVLKAKEPYICSPWQISWAPATLLLARRSIRLSHSFLFEESSHFSESLQRQGRWSYPSLNPGKGGGHHAKEVKHVLLFKPLWLIVTSMRDPLPPPPSVDLCMDWVFGGRGELEEREVRDCLPLPMRPPECRVCRHSWSYGIRLMWYLK